MRRALVVGCAARVWEDVDAATRICEYDAVYCVKQIGIFWPGEFQVWATLHPEFMDDYERQRVELGLPSGYEIVAPPACEVGMHGAKGRVARRVSYRWPECGASASSGIYGAKVAREDGFERVVLAGVPMEKDAGHFMPATKNGHGQVRGQVWSQVAAFLPGLEKTAHHLRGQVRSVSGYTAKILGEPTPEWLEVG